MKKIIIWLLGYLLFISVVFWAWPKCGLTEKDFENKDNYYEACDTYGINCIEVSISEAVLMNNYKLCPQNEVGNLKEDYFKIQLKIKHQKVTEINSDLKYSWIYEIENKIDKIVENRDKSKLKNNWKQIVKEIDYRLKTEKSEKIIYILNYLKDKINIDKITYLTENNNLPENFNSLSFFEKIKFSSTDSNQYTKEILDNGITYYRLWIWNGIGTKILRINTNLEVIIIDNFDSSIDKKYPSTLYIKNKWIISNKIKIPWLYEDFTYVSIEVYPNWDLIYNSGWWHEGEWIEYLYILDTNKIYNLYTDLIIPYLGENIIKFYVNNITNDTIVIEEHGWCCFFEPNENWLEYLTFDKETFKLLKREQIEK